MHPCLIPRFIFIYLRM